MIIVTMMTNAVNNWDENDSKDFNNNELDHYDKNESDNFHKNQCVHHLTNNHLVLIFLTWVTFVWAVVNGVAPCSS